MQPTRDALDRLRRLGLLPALGERLSGDAAALCRTIETAIIDSVPAFTETRNPDIEPEMRVGIARHVDSVAALLSGREPDDSYLAAHARLRARQRFPLDAELDACQRLGRILADALRDAAIEVADKEAELRQVVAATAGFAFDYANHASAALTREYVAETRRLAEAEGDRRSELLQLLLDGYDEADTRAARLLRRSGYLEQRQAYCVVLARSTNPAEMDNSARVDRILDALRQSLARLPCRLLAGVRDDSVAAIVSATRRLSGWTRPHTVVSELVYGPLRLLGPSVLVGVSDDVPSTSHIPRALGEANQALASASVARRVVRYSNIPFADLVVAAARRELGSSIPGWCHALEAADRRGRLAETLEAYADNDMNVLKTAEALGVHSNTIYARMQKIEDVTGRNPREYRALTELLLARACADV